MSTIVLGNIHYFYVIYHGKIYSQYEYVTRSAKRALIAFPIIHVWLIITPNLLKLSSCNYTHSYCQVRVVE